MPNAEPLPAVSVTEPADVDASPQLIDAVWTSLVPSSVNVVTALIAVPIGTGLTGTVNELIVGATFAIVTVAACGHGSVDTVRHGQRRRPRSHRRCR